MDCAICGGAMRQQKPWLFRCAGCGHLSSTLSAGAGTGIDGLEDLRRANFETLLDKLEALVGLRDKRVLEIGSAWGWFLEAAARRGARVHGIEPEEANAQQARALGFPVEIGLFPDGLADKGPYDIIVFNDVLEHIPGPGDAMQEVARLLKPGGLAVVNLPSSNGTLYRVAGLMDGVGFSGPFERMWQKGFPSPHISYFNPANLRRLVEARAELTQVAQFPLASLSRTGLWPRIRSSHPGLVGAVLYAGVYALSFVIAALPADIHVAVFRRTA